MIPVRRAKRAESTYCGGRCLPPYTLARNTAATDNPSFLQDPSTAISGPVIFVGRGGKSIDDDVVEETKNTIRAVRNYREDNEEEYQLWRNAVLNLGNPQV